jgi:hypothetical protein
VLKAPLRGISNESAQRPSPTPAEQLDVVYAFEVDPFEEPIELGSGGERIRRRHSQRRARLSPKEKGGWKVRVCLEDVRIKRPEGALLRNVSGVGAKGVAVW